MTLLSKEALKQMILTGDARAASLIRENPGTAEALIEDLLIETGHKLQTRFASLSERNPERYVFVPPNVVLQCVVCGRYLVNGICQICSISEGDRP